MAELTRFSVSLEKKLLEKFDRQIARDHYPTRSKAIADLISESLVKTQWATGKEVAGAVILVYDHHKHDLANTLNHIQHDYHHIIVSTQHIHLDHDNCLEIVVARGKPDKVHELAQKLKATKGVKYSSLAAASAGGDI